MQSEKNMQDFVITLLKNKLPASYYYHNAAHALYVMRTAIEIGQHESCTEKEIQLLSTAALWHDTGCIVTYVGHEAAGCVLTRQYLPDYGYSDSDINTICGMIMATRIPQTPQNKLEDIIADADLEYLGTKNAVIQAASLFRELRSLDPTLSEYEWDQRQINFLQKHRYFTRFCKQNREPGKLAYLNELKNRI